MNGKGSLSKPRSDCFGPFAVRGDLGASRFGPVYRGHDPSTNTRVVIRTLELWREQLESREQSDLLDSFRTLCETTREHPGLARPLACGAEGDIPYFVYSDLDGTAMDAVMRQDGPRPVAEVLQRATQLADAIDCAASAGLHHGLMAPCDVILDGERTGVTGFGLAQALIKAGIPAEAQSPYGSPQRLEGASPTHGDDIYSLAAITLELLIGTPRDPEQDTSRALREAQGLPERRRIQRPAPHETRMFTTIAGVDAGKLRAAFAAAFSDEPSERPSTAAEFFASLQDAISIRGESEKPAPSVESDKPAPSVVVVPFVSDEPDDLPPAPVLEMKGAEEKPTLKRPSRRERRIARRKERLVVSEAPIRESREHEPPASKPDIRLVRPVPIVEVELLEDVAPLRARSIDQATYLPPVQSESRALLVAGVAAVSVASFASGFGGGFVVGQRSSMHLTEPITVSQQLPVPEPRPTRVAVEEPKPIVSPAQTVAPVSNAKVSSSAPVAAAPVAAAPVAAPVAPRRTAPVVESGRLLVRSTPAGADVVIDGQPSGVTPLDLREIALGAHSIKVSHPGHDTRQRRVTLSERRPARSLDFELPPTGAPAQVAAATNPTGSLQVASHPTGAQVFVDDNLIGTTPFMLSNVAAGSRRLRIELPGYQTWTTSVQIEPSARFRVSASLEP